MCPHPAYTDEQRNSIQHIQEELEVTPCPCPLHPPIPCSYVREEQSTRVSLNLGVRPARMTLSLAAMHSMISPAR